MKHAPSSNSFQTKLKVFRKLMFIIFCLLACGAGMVLLGRMDDIVYGRGVIEGLREYEIKSTVQSRISALHFRPGDNVRKGELLLEIDDRELKQKHLQLSHTVMELEAELKLKEAQLALTRHDPLPKEYRHTSIQVQEAREKEVKSRRELQTFRDLRAKDAIAEMELQRKEIEYIQHQAELKRQEEDFQKLRSGMADKIIAAAEAEIAWLKSRLNGRKKELAMLETQLSEYQFRAPEHGTLAYIPTKIGEYVAPGDTLAILAAEGPRKFKAYVNEKDIYKVREGNKVRIASSQYNYFEYGYFYGTVYAIEELPQQQGTNNCYAVRIRMDEKANMLRLGSTGEAEIIVGRDFIFRVLSGI
ncbi:MAG: HlyD family efflux transporter periplasmic adaptor subunit [Lentisphaeria bacterium]|nr:HlyD family efflux transporter periplasmic adaptor subunit [Lentisphaeria bacterium]